MVVYGIVTSILQGAEHGKPVKCHSHEEMPPQHEETLVRCLQKVANAMKKSLTALSHIGMLRETLAQMSTLKNHAVSTGSLPPPGPLSAENFSMNMQN